MELNKSSSSPNSQLYRRFLQRGQFRRFQKCFGSEDEKKRRQRSDSQHELESKKSCSLRSSFQSSVGTALDLCEQVASKKMSNEEERGKNDCNLCDTQFSRLVDRVGGDLDRQWKKHRLARAEHRSLVGRLVYAGPVPACNIEKISADYLDFLRDGKLGSMHSIRIYERNDLNRWRASVRYAAACYLVFYLRTAPARRQNVLFHRISLVTALSQANTCVLLVTIEEELPSIFDVNRDDSPRISQHAAPAFLLEISKLEKASSLETSKLCIVLSSFLYKTKKSKDNTTLLESHRAISHENSKKMIVEMQINKIYKLRAITKTFLKNDRSHSNSSLEKWQKCVYRVVRLITTIIRTAHKNWGIFQNGYEAIKTKNAILVYASGYDNLLREHAARLTAKLPIGVRRESLSETERGSVRVQGVPQLVSKACRGGRKKAACAIEEKEGKQAELEKKEHGGVGRKEADEGRVTGESRGSLREGGDEREGEKTTARASKHCSFDNNALKLILVTRDSLHCKSDLCMMDERSTFIGNPETQLDTRIDTQLRNHSGMQKQSSSETHLSK
ncbi:hypothetical protein WN51_12052 [Melipona quadrifasciata]|uniref:Uncharacterized protein n=1 Tax=Melipona quadrifasciata TaxID=166423 RepID=A0A0M9A242_9HYME|nr:hypothetical protein WN51_12052 [Melipona quadrifasciata]